MKTNPDISAESQRELTVDALKQPTHDLQWFPDESSTVERKLYLDPDRSVTVYELLRFYY